jgi:hypothetical protein
MKISELYKYSWFADLAYVEWKDDNLAGQFSVDAAVAAERQLFPLYPDPQ